MSLVSPPEVFLTGEPNADKKTLSISSSRIQPFEEKNKDLFRLSFRLSTHFRPHSGAVVYPNTVFYTHIIFFARYQHIINDYVSKKITTFSGKVLRFEVRSASDQKVV